MFRLTSAFLTALSLVCASALGVAGGPRGSAGAAPASVEHSYRIVGSIRLLLFWRSSDVGSGRMAWRAENDRRSVALLFGSDPERAPRAINEWGYLREEIRSTETEAFTVQSTTDPLLIGQPVETAAAARAHFIASCSAMAQSLVRTISATVPVGDGVTYRTFGRVLDQIGPSSRWEERQMRAPDESEPGFLMALDRVMRSAVSRPGHARSLPRASYVYQGSLYELAAPAVQRLGRLTVGETVVDDGRRGQFSIRNLTTGTMSRFSVTFTPAGALAFVPIQIAYQPNWWLRVALELDDRADVPADPAADPDTLARIRAICGPDPLSEN